MKRILTGTIILSALIFAFASCGPRGGKKAADAQLFIFAQEKDWKSKLNSGTLERVAALIDDYEHCLKHIRSCRSSSKENKRKADIERILYRRGQ